jgi:hypothetical protein
MTHKLHATHLLFIVLLLLCVENVARFGLSIQQAIQLPDLPTSLSPVYVAAMSAVWAVAFGACAYGVARLSAWAPRVVIVTVLLYEANLWINRLVFSRSSEAYATVGFRVLLTLALIGTTIGLLLWPGTRKAFALRRRGNPGHDNSREQMSQVPEKSDH